MKTIIGTYKWAINMCKIGFDISNDNFTTLIRIDDDNNTMIKIFSNDDCVGYDMTEEDKLSKEWKIRIENSLIYVFANNIKTPKCMKQKRCVELIRLCFEHIYDKNNDWMLSIPNRKEIDVVKEIKLNILRKLGRYE